MEHRIIKTTRKEIKELNYQLDSLNSLILFLSFEDNKEKKIIESLKKKIEILDNIIYLQKRINDYLSDN